ncbi:MAG: hypothetical protein AMXMBFR52_09740 [Burkholderiales bacterium]
MRGPAILARTMSVATTRGNGGQAWQYHSRSDNHSKVACWTVLFDLLLECDIFRTHAERGRVGFGINHVMVNAADEFVTPSGAGRVNRHSQPDDARKVVRMLGQAIPLARDTGTIGYDVIGVTVVDCRNDGSPVRLVVNDPAPARDSHIHYDRMIVGLCSEYRARFGA